eukprot:TRINITY_DN5656_c0_g1_i1.p2 TRINITY_DN5656_c0_g1~~TRINITY_DN5656_c0_g1_i1.p2  ORF type:complete len:150 (-),score=36.30 TRINITY_DN5656_c0_g1_i1:24-473(-)
MATTEAKPRANQIVTFGRKKNAVAVVIATKGTTQIKVNGAPLKFMQPASLRLKLMEPILLVGKDKFKNLDLRIRVHGGGSVAQATAVRQAIAKAVVAYNQKYVDEFAKSEIKDAFTRYDRHLLVPDYRRCEPKKFGGPGARARYTKSYR